MISMEPQPLSSSSAEIIVAVCLLMFLFGVIGTIAEIRTAWRSGKL